MSQIKVSKSLRKDGTTSVVNWSLQYDKREPRHRHASLPTLPRLLKLLHPESTVILWVIHPWQWLHRKILVRITRRRIYILAQRFRRTEEQIRPRSIKYLIQSNTTSLKNLQTKVRDSPPTWLRWRPPRSEIARKSFWSWWVRPY